MRPYGGPALSFIGSNRDPAGQPAPLPGVKGHEYETRIYAPCPSHRTLQIVS